MLAWHYTIGKHFKMIEWSKVLLPASSGVTPPERPILWFSMNQTFEPTALKPVLAPDGSKRLLGVRELYEVGDGLFRFGIEPSHLRRGEELRRAAKMPPKVWRALHDEGREQGADPAHWLGHVGELSIDELSIEAMDDLGNWIPASQRS